MEVGHFYFLSEKYYEDFKDDNIQKNHETIGGISHGRPCFCAIPDPDHEYYWLIPISSKIQKYHKIAMDIEVKYRHCDKIIFGEVIGKERAFLIQNMIPVNDSYIADEYKQNGIPVRLEKNFEKELINIAQAVLKKHRHGVKLIYPDIEQIERILIYQEELKRLSNN